MTLQEGGWHTAGAYHLVGHWSHRCLDAFCHCVLTCRDLGQSTCPLWTLKTACGLPSSGAPRLRVAVGSQGPEFPKLDAQLLPRCLWASRAYCHLVQNRALWAGGPPKQLLAQAALLTLGADTSLPLHLVTGSCITQFLTPDSERLGGSATHRLKRWCLLVGDPLIFPMPPSSP